MATSLYFAPATASRVEAGTYPSAATNYANMAPTASVTTTGFMHPCAGPPGAVSFLEVNTGTGTTAKRNRFGRFFSSAFEEDYTYAHPTTAGTAIQYAVADWENNLAANHCVQQCFVYVWRPSTGAMVGTIQPVQVLAVGSKEPTAASSIRSTLGSYFSATPGTINILAGDILVFEPFSTYTKGSTTAYTTRFYYGGPTEMTTENATVATPASKVTFVVDLPLSPPIGVVRSAIRFSANVALFGPRFASALSVKARIVTAALSDGSPLNSSLRARTTVSAALTTQVLLLSSLKSISKWTAWVQQEHNLQTAAASVAQAVATFPNPISIDTLALRYSGGGDNAAPAQSLGGPCGQVLRDMTFATSGDLPGVEILAAHGMRPGTYSVRITGPTREVSLVLLQGLSEFSTTVAGTTAVVAVGSELSGFVVLRVTPNAYVSGTVSVSVADSSDTLFFVQSQAEAATGAAHYRCLYLANGTDSDAMNITLSLSYLSESSFLLGTEYPHSDYASELGAAALPLSIGSRALDTTGWGGTFALEQPRRSVVPIGGLPTLIGTPLPEAWSDGVTEMLPTVLADQTDSDARLFGVSFQPTLYWKRLPARKVISFWVKRTTPPGATRLPRSRLSILINADV